MQRDRLLLAEIVDAIERVIELAAGRSATDLDADRDRREALLWNYIVLGEAIGQLSDGTKPAHPEIPWQDPVRVRNRVVHGYWSIDLDVLITSARDDLPSFLGAVRAIDVEDLR